MSTGGIFSLIANDARIDRILTEFIDNYVNTKLDEIRSRAKMLKDVGMALDFVPYRCNIIKYFDDRTDNEKIICLVEEIGLKRCSKYLYDIDMGDILNAYDIDIADILTKRKG